MTRHLHFLASLALTTFFLLAALGCATSSETLVMSHPPDPALLTVAEKTEYRATALHADVVSLLDNLAASSPLARRVSMGTTTEGRDIPMLILADPPVSTAAEAREQARKHDKLIVLAIGNIHAGEVDGKEALPMLAREILAEAEPRGRVHPLLRDLILVFAPIYNADGNERVSKTNRPGQVGPEEGMGIRENAQGLDLNRDAIKAEAPETAALIRAFNELDPALFIDTHTTNGSYHRYVLTYAGVKAPATDPTLVAFTREKMLPAIAHAFHAYTKQDSFWYGNFEGEFGDAERGHTRWESFPAEARFLITYVGLRNRLSLLTEAYSYAPFKDRVLATRDFVRCALDYMAEHKSEISRLLDRADDRGSVRVEVFAHSLSKPIAIRSKMTPFNDKVTLKGYEEETVDGRSKSTGVPKDYEVELWDNFIAEKTVARPWAYLIPAEDSDPARSAAIQAVIAKLRQHGIEVRRLDEELEIDVEVYTIRTAQPASRQFQKHVLVNATTTTATRTMTFAKGSYFVPTAQPLGRLAVYMLEPECEDGLTTWNYFDAWMNPGVEFPAARLMTTTSIETHALE